MIKIGVCGICGKMGKRIAALALEDNEITLSAGFEKNDHAMIGKDIGHAIGLDGLSINILPGIKDLKENIDCVIDFTIAQSAVENVKICMERGFAMVIGTTGIDAAGEEIIKEAAKKIPIVYSPNMAIGVNVFFNLIKKAALSLKDFSVTIKETHHIHKKDAPSGTAKKMTQIVKKASGKDIDAVSFREGEVVGRHSIVFDNEYETLEMVHNAKSRDVFAAGSLKAAKYLKDKENGFYTMFDVLNLTV